jgi:hypothetical protein
VATQISWILFVVGLVLLVVHLVRGGAAGDVDVAGGIGGAAMRCQGFGAGFVALLLVMPFAVLLALWLLGTM